VGELAISLSAAPTTDAWAVYLLECIDGRVYTGIARDPENRYAKHLAGKGARFTRSNPPRQLLGWVWVASHGEALRLEIAWKRLPRAQRIAALREGMAASPESGDPEQPPVAAV
jgi:putative endonuclease